MAKIFVPTIIAIVATGSAVAADSPTATFLSTGALQIYTVPTGGTYTISAQGGDGGRASNGDQGLFLKGWGERMQANFVLTAGEKLVILVGGHGGDGSDGSGAGGGGGTFVVGSGGVLLLVAGGSGGGGGGNRFGDYGVSRNDLDETGGDGDITFNHKVTGGMGGKNGAGGEAGGQQLDGTGTYVDGGGAGGGGFTGDGMSETGATFTSAHGGLSFGHGGAGGDGESEAGRGGGNGGFGGGGGGGVRDFFGRDGGGGGGGGGGCSGGGGGAWTPDYGAGEGTAGGGGGSFSAGTKTQTLPLNLQDRTVRDGSVTITGPVAP